MGSWALSTECFALWIISCFPALSGKCRHGHGLWAEMPLGNKPFWWLQCTKFTTLMKILQEAFCQIPIPTHGGIYSINIVKEVTEGFSFDCYFESLWKRPIDGTICGISCLIFVGWPCDKIPSEATASLDGTTDMWRGTLCDLWKLDRISSIWYPFKHSCHDVLTTAVANK